MKIAAISENGTNVSQHFGRAPLCVVVTVENGKIVNKEKRNKEGHHTFTTAGGHAATVSEARHGYGAGALSRHAAMMQAIGDCQVLIAGGMGWGAYESLKSRGIETVMTDVGDIEQAVSLYLQGKLTNHMDRLH